MLVVGELWSIRVLLSVRVCNGLVQSASHCDVVGEICGQPAVEVGRPRLEMGGEPSVLQWQIIVLFFIHLLVHDILLGDTKRAAGPSFVDLGRSSRRLHASFEASITPPRCRDVGTVASLARCRMRRSHPGTHRSWFSSWVLSVLMALAGGMVR